MSNKSVALERYLQKYFSLTSFRKGQREIIQDVLNKKDVLGILPTGSGKSLCYQLPARLLNGITIVVSPLISLMVDQVQHLKAKHFKDVVAINSSMTFAERQYAYENLTSYKLIYVSPEILQHKPLLNRLQQLPIDLFVIDEAHCISQWGHEFRPDYLRLSEVIQTLDNPPILALSATATENVQQDIVNFLHRPQITKHIYPIDRPNISLAVQPVTTDAEKLLHIYEVLKDYQVPTLIYFSSRKLTERVANQLAERLPNHRISFYHGGMDQTDRLYIQQQFMTDQLDVICCTSAFGMGIDKQDIRLIIHYHMPNQLEAFIQEVGRAGRDGEASVSLTLYHTQDVYLSQRLIESELPTKEQMIFMMQSLKEMAKDNEKIPKDDTEIEQLFACHITQWRFMFYQLEKHAIIKDNRIHYDQEKWHRAYHKIKAYRKQRFTIKENQRRQVQYWLESEGCLRKELYKDFQRTVETVEENCCSQCGFVIEQWEPKSVKVMNQTDESWEERLKNIFFIGAFDETR